MSLLQDYDSDKQVSALGFGARVPPDGRVSHDFPLNLTTPDPYCDGIKGVLAAYNYALNVVKLNGPTNFSPVINRVAEAAQDYQYVRTSSCLFLVSTF